MSSSYTYRKIWITQNGPIPIDANNRTYEIHHADGNKSNNHINNLLCVSIEEHYDIHYKQQDWGACVMIAKRMNLSPSYVSDIQRGKKRPGIGGVKKGTIPWNKGKTGLKITWSEEGRKSQTLRSETVSQIKISDAEKIRYDFEQMVEVPNMEQIGIPQRNGKKQTYKNLFSKHYGPLYGVTPQYIARILNKKAKIHGI